MWALVTGSSSGIGRDMARYLYDLGYNLILVARNRDGLECLKKELEIKKDKQQIIVIPKNLSNIENCKQVYEESKEISKQCRIWNIWRVF